MPVENLICLIVWCAVFVLALIIELLTEQLVSVWFVVAAIPAIILSAISAVPFWVSIIVFFAVSAISLWISLSFFADKLRKPAIALNVDKLIGEKFTLLKSISSDSAGEIKINDIYWRCESEESLAKDTLVQVVEVRGNHLIVRQAPEESFDRKEEIQK